MVVKYIIEKFLDETSILDYGTQRNDLEFKKFCRLRMKKAGELLPPVYPNIFWTLLVLTTSENILR